MNALMRETGSIALCALIALLTLSPNSAAAQDKQQLRIVVPRIDDAEIPPYRDRARLPYVTEVESYRDRVRRMRTWNWLCGLDGEVALRWERSRPVEELLSAR